MKAYFFCISCIVTVACFAQDPISYSEVVTVDSTAKDVLFARARRWVVGAFRSYKAVVEIEDKTSGELSGKAIMLVPAKVKALANYRFNASVSFLFRLQVKDGKYRYLFEGFNNTSLHPTSTAEVPTDRPFGTIVETTDSPVKWTMWPKKKMDEAWIDVLTGTKATAMLLAASLKTAMVTPDDF